MAAFVWMNEEVKEALDRWDVRIEQQCAFHENEVLKFIAWAAIGVEEFGDAEMEGDMP